MNAERWRKVSEIFEAALRSDPGALESLLRDVVAVDPTLRDEVERLLADDTVASFGKLPDVPNVTDGQPGAPRPTWALMTVREPASGEPMVCPHCRNPIERVESRSVRCPSCGASLQVEPGPNLSWGTPGQGQTVGRFTLRERVGSGAFGAVYKAFDPKLDRLVALKVLRVGQFATETDRARFLREARNAAQLRHPSIVAVHEVGEHDGTPFIVSDFIQGITLRDRLNAGRLPFHEAVRIVAEIAEALQYAHDRGIVHRDIKPSNIMLDENGRPHLTDFGLAKRNSGDVTMTIEGDLLGTPAYMSPEQARGEGYLSDPRGDVYSLGVILFELLTGERPFHGNERMLLHHIINTEPPSPRSVNNQVPRDLEMVSLKAIAKDSALRYATAGELAQDLRRALDGQPVGARPITRTERAWRWCRRNRWLAVAGGSAAAALVIATISLACYAALSLRVAWEQRQSDLSVRNATVAMEARWNQDRFAPGQDQRAQAEATATVKTIRERLNGAWDDPRLQREIVERVDRVEREVGSDQGFLKLLNDFDRNRTAEKETGIEGTAAGYAAAAGAAHLDPMDAGAGERLALLLQGRSAADRKALTARLEAWAMVEWKRTGTRNRSGRLIELVKALDPDPDLDRLRDAWLAHDETTLAHLVRSEKDDELGPTNIRMLVSWLISVNDRPRAIALLKRGLLRYPHDVWLNFDLATNLAGQGSAGEAESVTYFRVARALRPGTGHELAHLLQNAGQTQEAEQIFRELTGLTPDNAQNLICLGALLKQAGGREKEGEKVLAHAVEKAVEAANRRPTDPLTSVVLGNALGQSGRIDEAIAAYRRALAIEPGLANYHVNIADLLIRRHQSDEAITEYKLALKAAPDDFSARMELGDALRKSGQTYAAIEQYREAVRLQPGSPRVRLVLADLLRLAKRPDESIAQYRKGLEARPEDTSSRFNLAGLLAGRGETTEAIEQYRRALGELDSPDARLGLADLLRQDGRNEDAVQEYRHALKARPDVVPALLSLGLVLQDLGRYEDAATVYDRAVTLSASDREAAGRIEPDRRWARQLADLSRRLPDVLSGKDVPADATERALFAQIAFRRGHDSEAVGLWEKAFADDPKLAPHLRSGYRADAVRAAAHAGTVAPRAGTSQDPERATALRETAAEWLSAELASYKEGLRRPLPEDRMLIRKRLRVFKQCHELARVRDDPWLSDLPPRERAAWRALWSDVNAILSTLAPPPIPPAS